MKKYVATCAQLHDVPFTERCTQVASEGTKQIPSPESNMTWAPKLIHVGAQCETARTSIFSIVLLSNKIV